MTALSSGRGRDRGDGDVRGGRGYAEPMKTVGEPEEIRIPREDERPEILPVEEPVPEGAPEREADPVPN